MRLPVHNCILLLISLFILLPVLANAEPGEEIRNELRSRIMRHRTQGVAPAATRPAPTSAATATANPMDSSDDPTYGYTTENPVKLGGADLAEGIEASKYYLRLLRDRNNKTFITTRIGSVAPGKDGHIMDLYKLIDSEGVEHRLYIDVYHPEIHPKEAKAPKGMTKKQ